jgi:hypothetical protein
VAVSETATVDPSQPTRRERMPHELPQGMSVERLGLRAMAVAVPPPMQVCAGMAPMAAAGMPPPAMRPAAMAPRSGPRPSHPARPAAPPPPPPAPGRMSPPRAHKAKREQSERGRWEIPGRVALLRPDGVVLELTAVAALFWDPARITATFHDGSVRRAEVVLEQTTRSGQAAPGQLLRLALRWVDPALPAGAPRIVEIESGGVSIVIAVA